MIEPLDYDKLNENQQKVFREISALRDRNVARIAKIEQYGYSVDVWTARIEHFMMSLLSIGVITVDQLLLIQKDWELSLRKQTKMMAEQAEALFAQQRAATVAPKLWTPGG